MKKISLILAALIVLSPVAEAKMRFEKTAENRVHTLTSIERTDATTGEKIHVWNPQTKRDIGIQHVFIERAQLNNQKRDVQASGYVDDLVDEINIRLIELDRIEEVIKGDIGNVIVVEN